jgi:type IV fimbrial biogenesis protein FimT
MSKPRLLRGVTLIEMMIVIVIVGTLSVLVGPSFVRLIEVQRVRSINAAVATDMQYARTEAVARGAFVRISFETDAATQQTCYSIYTYTNHLVRCNCLVEPACTAPDQVEIKTVRMQRNSWFQVRIEPRQQKREFAFEPVTGSLYEIPTDFETEPIPRFLIRTSIDTNRSLMTIVGLSGTVRVCRTPTSGIQEVLCD